MRLAVDVEWELGPAGYLMAVDKKNTARNCLQGYFKQVWYGTGRELHRYILFSMFWWPSHTHKSNAITNVYLLVQGVFMTTPGGDLLVILELRRRRHGFLGGIVLLWVRELLLYTPIVLSWMTLHFGALFGVGGWLILEGHVLELSRLWWLIEELGIGVIQKSVLQGFTTNETQCLQYVWMFTHNNYK